MRAYFEAGLKAAALILLSLLAVSAAGYGWPILISVTAVQCFIDQEILSGTLLSLLALVGYIAIVGMVLIAIEILLESWPGWIREAKEAMYLRHRVKLEARIRSLKAPYRKYKIYPKLNLLKEYDGY